MADWMVFEYSTGISWAVADKSQENAEREATWLNADAGFNDAAAYPADVSRAMSNAWNHGYYKGRDDERYGRNR